MPPAENGYWGNVTATIDWCETNYEITEYIAEFSNTISNLCMILPSLLGMYTSWRYRLGTKFICCYLCLLVVGVGSWCFHMTLKYEMQLLDEIPMIFASCCLLYSIQMTLEPEDKRNSLLILILFLYSVVLVWTYVAVKIVILHQAGYILLVLLSMRALFRLSKTKHLDRKMVCLGIGLYFFGGFVWLADNQLCGHLQNARLKLPFVLRPVTQLHAWWHFFSGYTTYLNIVGICHARLNYLKMEPKVRWGPLGVWLSAEDKSYKE